MIQGFDPKMAFIVNAAFAVIFLVFFLFLPVVGGSGYSVKGTDLFNDVKVGPILVLLVILLAPVASVLVTYMKKKICPCIIGFLAWTYLVFILLISAEGMGIGSILNIIIVLAPWCLFTYYRKDMPAEI